MPPHVVEPLLSEETVRQRVESLAAELAQVLPVDPVVVGLFKGAFVFCADLARALSRHGVAPELAFMVLSSYGKETQSSGRVRVALDCDHPLQGRVVLLLDDILDSGRTLDFAVKHLQAKGAARVISCVLLDKPERRQIPFEADFVGFSIPNVFVVGCGIDYAEQHRELPFIGAVAFTSSGEIGR
ncbi:MAG: hypoxanthine phosphoribosyltransferase [Magnetococcales bacterium]|nr:hypoxanthine phosphoribosyltransferase [Magnetococcales bacterium]